MSVLVSQFLTLKHYYCAHPSLTVNAHPDDPQARNGLKTCMDVLHRMSIAWPSAGRAWELLYGCKANARNSVCSLSTTNIVRPQKRTADHFLDDSTSLYQVELPSVVQGPRRLCWKLVNVCTPAAIQHGIFRQGRSPWFEYQLPCRSWR